MKDAFGGILNIFIISIFLVIVSGILALTVNYTKAFKMKNSVISAIEQYEGHGCFKSGVDTSCKSKIHSEAVRLGYDAVKIKCASGFTLVDNTFCYRHNDKENNYSVITQVNIEIPIINRMGFSAFQVHGDTRTIGASY